MRCLEDASAWGGGTAQAKPLQTQTGGRFCGVGCGSGRCGGGWDCLWGFAFCQKRATVDFTVGVAVGSVVGFAVGFAVGFVVG